MNQDSNKNKIAVKEEQDIPKSCSMKRHKKYMDKVVEGKIKIESSHSCQPHNRIKLEGVKLENIKKDEFKLENIKKDELKLEKVKLEQIKLETILK